MLSELKTAILEIKFEFRLTFILIDFEYAAIQDIKNIKFDSDLDLKKVI